jgi:hypothetical protein
VGGKALRTRYVTLPVTTGASALGPAGLVAAGPLASQAANSHRLNITSNHFANLFIMSLRKQNTKILPRDLPVDPPS